ncbi:MAG TPA: hypothetical protein VJ437_11155 [Acidiferrobacterales bacterium]|nr:hypothetical protein [Acidiferrobacterales bacterium]
MSGKPGQRPSQPLTPPDRFEPGFIATTDMRFALPKLLRERLRALVADLGGADSLSYQERSLAERLIHLEWQIGEWEAAARDGKPVDQARYLHAVNALNGLVRSLGMKRRQKPVQTLEEFLREPHPAPEESEPHAE